MAETVDLVEESAGTDTKKKKSNKLIVGIVIAVVVIIAAILVVTKVVIPAQEKADAYEAAVALCDAGEYGQAVIALNALGDYKDAKEKLQAIYSERLVENGALKTAEVGDVVYFGAYEQDNNLSNGKEEIAWRVLAIEDGKALLISVYGLDQQVFNKSRAVGNDWETSDLKNWLDTEFAPAAFDASETQYLNGGLICLSVDEAKKYFSSEEDRMCGATDYAISQGVWPSDNLKVDGISACRWWLRSPGVDSYAATCVYTAGYVNSGGYMVTIDNYAVRPAAWVNL